MLFFSKKTLLFKCLNSKAKKNNKHLLHLTNGCANHTRKYHMIPIKFYLKFVLFLLFFQCVTFYDIMFSPRKKSNNMNSENMYIHLSRFSRVNGR